MPDLKKPEGIYATGISARFANCLRIVTIDTAWKRDYNWVAFFIARVIGPKRFVNCNLLL